MFLVYIIKNRFKYLQNPINSHCFRIFDSDFKNCCILHNIILQYDKKYLEEMKLWEDDVLVNIDVFNLENNCFIEEVLLSSSTFANCPQEMQQFTISE